MIKIMDIFALMLLLLGPVMGGVQSLVDVKNSTVLLVQQPNPEQQDQSQPELLVQIQPRLIQGQFQQLLKLPNAQQPPADRIVGGLDTTIEELPYQVSLFYLGNHMCGATILNNNAVITAAHCVSGRYSRYLRVRAGHTEARRGIQKQVVRYHVHENFSINNMDNDIAILIVSPPFVYSKKIQPVTLMNSNVPALTPTTALIVSGWGATSEGGQAAKVLQYTQVSLIDSVMCTQMYSKVNPVTDNMFCAGTEEGGKDSCQGDSGGPLVAYVGEGGTPVLCGIVSWGMGCARQTHPGVYTKVEKYGQWIQEKLESS